MKLLFPLLLLITLSHCSFFCSEEETPQNHFTDLFFQIQILNKTTPTPPKKCTSSPLATLLQKYYTGHPYQHANVHRDPAEYDPYNLIFHIGDAEDYLVEANETDHGTFCQVFRGIHKKNRTSLAFKVIKSSATWVLKEIQILKDLQDAPNFLPLREVLMDSGKFGQSWALAFDFFQFSSLKEMWPTFTKLQLKKRMFETFKALDYIHSKGIIHRDMKHWNILKNNKTSEVKVIDFGISDYYLPGKELTPGVGTIYYQAPEMLLNYAFHDYSVDIWSAGVMFGEMMFRKFYLFQTKRNRDFTNVRSDKKRLQRTKDQLDAIAEKLGTVELLQYASKFKENMELSFLSDVDNHKKIAWKSLVRSHNEHLVDDLGIDLLSKLLVIDHTKRITAKEAMLHKYFDDVRS